MPCCAGLVRFSKYSLFYTDCHPNRARDEATNMGEEIMSIECRHSPNLAAGSSDSREASSC